MREHALKDEKEEQENVSGKKYHHYDHPESEPDDAGHICVYSLIAESLESISPPLVVMDLF
jgi:hypothetical protein